MVRELLLGLALAAIAPAAAQDLKVLSTRNLPAGHKMQVVRDAQGREFRRLVKPAANQAAAKKAAAKIDFEEPPVVDFYEGFEDYKTEYGINWIPSDWTEQNTEANIPTEEQLSHNINMTWYVYESSNMFQDMTTDGTHEAFIHFGYVSEENGLTGAAQDEWLISPEIELGDNETLRFLNQADFFDVYDCTDFDWTALTYPERIVVNTLSVMLSTDNGETWTRIWDLAADVTSKLTDKECYDKSDLTLEKYAVSLSKYAGKKVKIAFRYIRSAGAWMGNSMIVDAVTVDHPAGATGVDGVKAGTNAKDEYFTIDGVSLGAKPSQHGVYLKRSGNTTRKVAL